MRNADLFARVVPAEDAMLSRPGDPEAPAKRMVKPQRERGDDLDLDTAVWRLGSQVLSAQHPTRDEFQAVAETWRLAQRGDLDELRARADAGDWNSFLLPTLSPSCCPRSRRCAD